VIRHLAGLLIVAGLILLVFAAATGLRAAECGKASFYAEAHHGKTMANGQPFNMNAMTAASNSLPLGSRARVETMGKSHSYVDVRITDTGGFGKYGRIVDLSKAAFAKLAPTSKGVIRVCVTRVR
jgi:rare lipoprotein A